MTYCILEQDRGLTPIHSLAVVAIAREDNDVKFHMIEQPFSKPREPLVNNYHVDIMLIYKLTQKGRQTRALASGAWDLPGGTWRAWLEAAR
ncbi:hypothetical protein HYFRA_00011934 [Hymenoscyphus fraxineus]|uniref:Uncharacterized protein n=1 Tax=Hymenoscyphus fraxineus TaxID=746836 RepID=A0A9N9L1T0_9HELO|nr:hypothetical protein HYFRA_00011934 [Hymenoscyphus fraxineus]